MCVPHVQEWVPPLSAVWSGCCLRPALTDALVLTSLCQSCGDLACCSAAFAEPQQSFHDLVSPGGLCGIHLASLIL